MFSRNGQYILNEFEEDTFDKQLPFSSIKVPFKKQKQKIFNRIQQKYQLELLKQQIHQKCKAEELTYLDQLQKERLKFNQIKEQEEKRKKQYLLNIVQKKYQLQHEKNIVQKARSKTQQPLRDSIDDMKNQNEKNQENAQKTNKMVFSLEPTQEKKVELVKEDDWIKRVMMGRKMLQAKLGNYHSQQPKKKDSDSDTSSNDE